MLDTSPQIGSSLGHDCYKVRIAIASKVKFKLGGARVITHLHEKGSTVNLFTINPKKNQFAINIFLN